MSKEYLTFSNKPEPNFEWKITEDMSFVSTVKRTIRNRFKWWISTKLFLPGTAGWIETERE